MCVHIAPALLLYVSLAHLGVSAFVLQYIQPTAQVSVVGASASHFVRVYGLQLQKLLCWPAFLYNPKEASCLLSTTAPPGAHDGW